MRKISKAAVGVVAIMALLANINAMPVGHFRNGDDNDSVKTNGAKTDTLTEAPHPGEQRHRARPYRVCVHTRRGDTAHRCHGHEGRIHEGTDAHQPRL